MFFHVEYPLVGMGGFGSFIARDWWFLNKGPCPVYWSGRGRYYVGNDVVDESEMAETLVFWCALHI